MSLMMGSLYNALLRANVPEDVARQAAEEVAGYESRIANVERKLDIVTWMVGTAVAVGLGNLWLSFSILMRLAP